MIQLVWMQFSGNMVCSKNTTNNNNTKWTDQTGWRNGCVYVVRASKNADSSIILHWMPWFIHCSVSSIHGIRKFELVWFLLQFASQHCTLRWGKTDFRTTLYVLACRRSEIICAKSKLLLEIIYFLMPFPQICSSMLTIS